MANLTQRTFIGAPSAHYGYSLNPVVTLGSFNYRLSDADQSSRFLHFKTNIPTSSDRMAMIEAVGFSYATMQPIHCQWGFYISSNTILQVALQSYAPGMVPNTVYMSADNFVCISTTSRNLYFIGATLNTYTVNGLWGGGQDIVITTAGSTTSAGNLF